MTEKPEPTNVWQFMSRHAEGLAFLAFALVWLITGTIVWIVGEVTK